MEGDSFTLFKGDAANFYRLWDAPTCIVSDGGYGILGFDGDASHPSDLTEWYLPHIKIWSEVAAPFTTLWFWNTEVGWATVHPELVRSGWEYVNCNIWDKGKGHIAGNVNTRKIRRFPVVTELCAQYTRTAEVGRKPIKLWLRKEWERTGLPLRAANEACGVRDAAVRKYLDQGHLWYFPPPSAFEGLAKFANKHGDPAGRPYFSLDGKNAGTKREWARMRAKFYCPHGVTNVWHRPPLRGKERIRVTGKTGHLNQKPLDLMERVIVASTDENDVVWEPFGGLFSACLAAATLGRMAFGAEIDPDYFTLGAKRLADAEVSLIPRFSSGR
ncbi:MAG: site-specific DNA-methyltransferase [Alphaproteobacteria bacterium]|nr:site-specific DNA-methyltransferase [Alphaproteobacteria bacterium]MDA7988403.1 site-specific DNA-methyltransferase [Alphaproteobacteria bacterium]